MAIDASFPNEKEIVMATLDTVDHEAEARLLIGKMSVSMLGAYTMRASSLVSVVWSWVSRKDSGV